MVVLLNKYCCGGKGIEKWNKIHNHLITSNTTVINVNDSDLLDKFRQAVNNGENFFMAAGGDGTVNFLLNMVIETANQERLKKISLGAVGIGSSNDFHKPVSTKIDGIPLSNEFEDAALRDVGMINYESNGKKLTKYFLINASVGITAEANNLFNKTDLILRRLKKVSTKMAILYSAVKTILTYQNLSAPICFDGSQIETSITNLGIAKNPHFSGDFCYDSSADYDDGKFNIHMAYDMRKLEVLKLMKALTTKRFSYLEKTKTWQSDRIIVSSKKNFAVEFDGEVITTNKVEFQIRKKFIKVCDNGKLIRN